MVPSVNASWKIAWINDDFPAPVLPMIPIFSYIDMEKFLKDFAKKYHPAHLFIDNKAQIAKNVVGGVGILERYVIKFN